MNAVGIFNNVMMHAKGYKKVALKDTKKILNETNNYKWVKETAKKEDYGKDITRVEIYPSGTQVKTELSERNSVYGILGGKETHVASKEIIKPDGTHVLRSNGGRGTYGIYQYNKAGNAITNEKTLAKRTYGDVERDITNAKRQRFIDNFNKKYDRQDIKGADGSRSKYVIDKKTGNIVSFWRKDAQGGITKGNIDTKAGGQYREISMTDSQGNFHDKTVQYITDSKKGRYVEGIKIPENEGALGAQEYSYTSFPNGEVRRELTPTEAKLAQLQMVLEGQNLMAGRMVQ